MDRSSIVLFILPSLRIGGGTLEAMRLAGELRLRGIDARILSLWRHPNSSEQLDIPDITATPISYLSGFAPRKLRAPFDLWLFMLRYRRYLKELQSKSGNSIPTVVLTHYSTLPFGWFTPPAQRYVFMQDEEWLFLPNGLRRHILRKFILVTSAHCRVIASNAYIGGRMRSAGITPVAEAPVWAASSFCSYPSDGDRPIDFVMLLRYGSIKRLDLYMDLMAKAKGTGYLSCAVITPEDSIAAEVDKLADICLLRPSNEEMKALYQRSKVFVLLSDREGFGLPPLEAMGSGCVPLCRDSGGVRCYMTGGMTGNLVPLDASLDSTFHRLETLVADDALLTQLSLEARRIFIEGAKETSAKRERSLALLTGE